MLEFVNGINVHKIGSDGFIYLVDKMGTESSIIQAARVSYGEGTKSISDDTTLIRYLMRHRHTTPFEMVVLKFHVRVPMDCWRQWIRHRMSSTNEYSTRYSEAIDSMAVTDPNEWRLQSQTNKQGSSNTLQEWPENTDNHIPIKATTTPGEYLTQKEQEFQKQAQEIYQTRLKFGVAREQARKDLPLSTYTEAYWKIDLHNLLHFLSLRMDSHAQLEIREYANTIGKIVAEHYPNVWQAFEDYRLNAITLTALDIKAIIEDRIDHITNKREKAECLEKCRKLNIEIYGHESYALTKD